MIRPGSILFVFGLVRIGLVFLLPLVDTMTVDFSLPLRSFAYSEILLLACDSSAAGFSMPVQSFGRPESMISIFGIACADPVFPLSLVDTCIPGSSLSLRSFARLDFGLSVLDMSHPGSSMFARSTAYFGFSLFVTGLARAGFVSLLSMIDSTTLGFVVPTRSLA